MPADTRALAQRAAPRARFIGILATLAVMSAPPIAAQDGVHPTKRALFNSIEWTEGEKQVDISNLAEFTVPAGCQYTDAEGARKFLALTENPTSGREQGVLFCRANAADSSAAGQPWFVLFDPSGYVRDDEKKLDADKILASIRAGTAQGNELRKSRGWDELTIDGWIRSPHYDPTTHNLTWSIRAHFCAVVRLGRGRRRAARLTVHLLWPFSAPRAAELVLEHAVAGAAPLMVARKLLGSAGFAAWVRPRAYDALCDVAEARDASALSTVVGHSALAAIIDAAPTHCDPGERYCPRCARVYRAGIAACAECRGLRLVERTTT